MQAKHYLLLAGIIGGFGLQIAGLEHGLSEMLTPKFLGGTLVMISNSIIAVFVESPKESRYRNITSRMSQHDQDERDDRWIP